MARWPEEKAVLLVAESLRPSAITRYAQQLLRGLLAEGLRPVLLSPDAPEGGSFEPAAEAALRVVPGLGGGLLSWPTVWRTAALARLWQPALIHGLSAFTAPVCARLARLLRRPYLLSVHHYQQHEGLRLDRLCRRVLACSEAIRENLVNDARVPRELVTVVPLGISLPSLSARPAVPAGRLPLVATLTKLIPRKDVGTFLRAAALVQKARGGEVQFLVGGEGPEEPRLRRLTRELGLEKHVVFTSPGVPREQVLPDVDVYVETTTREGFGMGVLEAMSYAKPVVATAVGGLIPLVREGQTGYLVPVGAPEAVAERIGLLLSDPGLRVRLGQAGRALVEEQFSLARMLEETAEAYAGILAAG